MNASLNGGYRDGCSVVHRLDALVKLIALFLLFAAVILTDTLPGYALMAAALAAVVYCSGIGLRAALGGLGRLWLFFLVIFLMNAFFFETEETLWRWWIFSLSEKGIAQGVHVVVRTALSLLFTNVFIASTPPLEITGALESLLFPLGFLGVPVRDAAMILGVAIQFVPIFLEETETIRMAQTARGARFESRRLSEKAQAVLPLVIPIFLSAFRRADELSTAMESRGYRRVRGRPRWKKRALHPADGLAIVFGLLAMTAGILL